MTLKDRFSKWKDRLILNAAMEMVAQERMEQRAFNHRMAEYEKWKESQSKENGVK